MTLADYRAQFDLPSEAAYLDHAATGVLSRPAHDAAADYLAGRAGRVDGRTPNNFPVDLDRVERSRRRVARLVGADARNVCHVPNTSYGLNLLAQGLDWQPGDRIAVPACEFPSNLLPWRALAHLGVEVDLIPHTEGTFSVADVEAALYPRTRLVAVSWVQFLSGFRCDLEGIAALCRDRNLLLAVDAIQGIGALRFNTEAVQLDLVAFGFHKWMCGMQGVGYAVVADTLLHRLRPTRGWLNGPVDWDDFENTGDDLHDDATRFYVGTFPTAALYAADAATGLLLDAGTDAIEAAVLDRAGRLGAALDRLGAVRYGSADPAHASGIVTVRVDDPEAMHAHLMANGVVCSMRSRLIRFAPHAQTRDADLDRATEAVRSFGKTTVAVV